MIRFWCSACGHELEAEASRAGRAMECGQCGAVVDVPNNPPPLAPLADGPRRRREEGEGYDDYTLAVQPLSAGAAAAADGGLKFLQFSLLLYPVTMVVGLATNAVRISIDGFEKLIAGDPGDSRGVLIAGSCLNFVILAAATALRFVGYGKCRGVAAAVGSGVLPVCRWGVVLAAAGTVISAVPAFFQSSPPKPDALLLLPTMLGGLLATAGLGMEFAALAFYNRLLHDYGTPADAGRVKKYAWSLGSFVVFGFLAACGFGMAVGMVAAMAVRPRPGMPAAAPPAPGAMFANIPPEVGFVGAGIALLFFCVGVFVCVQYWNILGAGRAAVRNAAVDTPRV